MKYLIYGGNGWIGSQMIDLLKKEDITFIKSSLRVDDTEEVEKEIIEIKPTHIMCFIGRTHGTYNNEKIGTIDYLEKPGKLVENIRDNLFSPLSIALLCCKHNTHLTYLGTGCIFTKNELKVNCNNFFYRHGNNFKFCQIKDHDILNMSA